jgi:D-aspartate ligase
MSRNMEEKIKNIARGKRVLVLEGYCKQCLPFIREFRNLGCEVTLLCNSKWDCGYVSRLPKHKILGICDMKRPKESEEYIVNLVKTRNYDIVFPLFDFSARILSHNKEELSKYAIICANDKTIFDKANDKNEVMRVCMENNVPCPKTLFNVASIEDVTEGDLAFPIIIKPRRMYGARGFHIFENKEEFKEYVRNKNIQLADYVVQEFIPFGSKVMGGNIYIDREGNIKSSYLYACEHLYPENGGTSTLNAILIRPDVKANCERLCRIMNLRGVIGVDLMIDNRDNVGKVIEINVRPVHGITLGFIAGVNHAQQVLEDCLELPVTSMEATKTDTCLRILQTDVLWFLSSKNRLKNTYRKLGYKHVKEQMFYWDDPLPWFAFLLGGLKDYRKKMMEKTQ